ncbi:MAG: hypothetical protein LBD29_10215 [Treponema sp.]|nr:hypothetical protein [Treponema sp.]
MYNIRQTAGFGGFSDCIFTAHQHIFSVLYSFRLFTTFGRRHRVTVRRPHAANRFNQINIIGPLGSKYYFTIKIF